MRPLAIALVFACTLVAGACSRSDNATAVQPTPTPNLRADADRLQQAINKAAEQRKQQSSPSPTAAAP